MHFSPIQNLHGWSSADAGDDQYKVEDKARKLNKTRPQDTYFVCGFREGDPKHLLYRIETIDAMAIPKQFEIGSYAEWYVANASNRSIDQLSIIHSKNPIVPYFSDPAGFKCEFTNDLTEEFTALLDATLTEGCEIYADEGEVGPVVLRKGFLQLWWD